MRAGTKSISWSRPGEMRLWIATSPAMEILLADDYIAITPNGTLQSKEQTLANLRSGAMHIKSLEFSDRKVRFYGQTALVTSRAEVNGTNCERPTSQAAIDIPGSTYAMTRESGRS